MTDSEIVKAWEKVLATGDAPVGEHWGCSVTTKLAKETFDMLNRQKAEIERLQGFYKPTKTSGYKIENGKVVFYTNLLNGYRHEYKDLEEVVKELNMMLQRCYLYDDNTGYFKSKIKELRTEKTEAIKEFVERFNSLLAEFADYDTLHIYEIKDRVDIVKEMTEGNNENNAEN